MLEKNSFDSKRKFSRESVDVSVSQSEFVVELDDVQQAAIVGGASAKKYDIIFRLVIKKW